MIKALTTYSSTLVLLPNQSVCTTDNRKWHQWELKNANAQQIPSESESSLRQHVDTACLRLSCLPVIRFITSFAPPYFVDYFSISNKNVFAPEWTLAPTFIFRANTLITRSIIQPLTLASHSANSGERKQHQVANLSHRGHSCSHWCLAENSRSICWSNQWRVPQWTLFSSVLILGFWFPYTTEWPECCLVGMLTGLWGTWQIFSPRAFDQTNGHQAQSALCLQSAENRPELFKCAQSRRKTPGWE